MTGSCHIGNTNSDSQGLWTPITRMSAEAHVQGEGRLCKWELRDKLLHKEEKENSLLERRKAQHMRTPSPPQLSKRNREALVGDQKVGHGKQRCLPLFLSLLLLPSALGSLGGAVSTPPGSQLLRWWSLPLPRSPCPPPPSCSPSLGGGSHLLHFLAFGFT